MARQGPYIIYGLFDPRNGELRYIGKSTRGLLRVKSHARPDYLSRERTLKSNWIRSLQAKGLTYEYCVLEEHASAEDLVEAEVWNIAYFKSLGCRLTNMTLGGEGAVGRKTKPETTAKIVAKTRGRKRTPEQLKLLSEAHLGLSPSNKGCPFDQKTRQKMKESKVGHVPPNKGVPYTEKQKLALGTSRAIRDQHGRTYGSLSFAARELGLSSTANVHAVLKGKRPTVKGFKFEYVNPDETPSSQPKNFSDTELAQIRADAQTMTLKKTWEKWNVSSLTLRRILGYQPPKRKGRKWLSPAPPPPPQAPPYVGQNGVQFPEYTTLENVLKCERRIVPSESGCRIWTGKTDQHGYGAFWVAGKEMKAHRFVFEAAYGQIPDGLLVIAVCGNHSCVRESHLAAVTIKEKIANTVSKARHAHGSTTSNAKLSEAIVREIRAAYVPGKVKQAELAERYGISVPHVSMIVNRRIWRHI